MCVRAVCVIVHVRVLCVHARVHVPVCACGLLWMCVRMCMCGAQARRSAQAERMAWLWLGSARLGSSARVGSGRFGSARLGSE